MKKLLKYLGYFLLTILLLGILFHVLGRSLSSKYVGSKYESLVVSPIHPVKSIDPNWSPRQVDSLNIIYGNHKVVPEAYRTQILLALSQVALNQLRQ